MKRAERGGAVFEPKIPLPVPEGHLLAGKYRVERVIGAGGMGVVVSAIHIHLGQRVAIKFLLPHAVADEQTLARFAREARALARIESEHVGRVIDVGFLDTGEPYTVLECLSGRNLAELLDARGALEVGEAVAYIIEACQAMAEAHALGIIHRDLKPENLFLADRADGSQIVKVIDFGVSKIAADMVELEALVTASSAVVGSPLYMSPEQLRAARDVDARTDIWSLGVTLYELLTAQGPFRWATLPELCAAILKDPPRPLRQLRPDVPEELETVVMRCLERDPARRPSSAAELARELRPFSDVAAAPLPGRISSTAVSVRASFLPPVKLSPSESDAISSETTAPLSSVSLLPALLVPVRVSPPSAPTAPPERPPSTALGPPWREGLMRLSDLTPPTGITTITSRPDRRRQRLGSLRVGLAVLTAIATGVGLSLLASWVMPPTPVVMATQPAAPLRKGGAAEFPGPISAAPPRPSLSAPEVIAAKPTATIATGDGAPPPSARAPESAGTPHGSSSSRPSSARPVRRSNPGSAFEHRK